MAHEPLVLITRTQPGAAQTAASAGGMGMAAVVAPLLHIAPLKLPDGVFDDVQGVIISSPNAAMQCVQNPPHPRTPILCVGDATSKAARKAGCRNVISADGDGDALISEATRRFSPYAGRLVFLRGMRVAVDVAASMRGCGFQVDEAFAYDARPIDALPGPAITALRNGSLTAAMFHSAAGAQTFAKLTQDAGLDWACRRMIAAGMSTRALAPLSELSFLDVVIAPKPQDEALLYAVARSITWR